MTCAVPCRIIASYHNPAIGWKVVRHRFAATSRALVAGFRRLRLAGKGQGMRVSIIIPTLNEAAGLGNTLRSLREQRPHEIIVVDGGSTDAPGHLASGADRLLHGPPG